MSWHCAITGATGQSSVLRSSGRHFKTKRLALKTGARTLCHEQVYNYWTETSSDKQTKIQLPQHIGISAQLLRSFPCPLIAHNFPRKVLSCATKLYILKHCSQALAHGLHCRLSSGCRTNSEFGTEIPVQDLCDHMLFSSLLVFYRWSGVALKPRKWRLPDKDQESQFWTSLFEQTVPWRCSERQCKCESVWRGLDPVLNSVTQQTTKMLNMYVSRPHPTDPCSDPRSDASRSDEVYVPPRRRKQCFAVFF